MYLKQSQLAFNIKLKIKIVFELMKKYSVGPLKIKERVIKIQLLGAMCPLQGLVSLSKLF
jgi:hypothetical protein